MMNCLESTVVLVVTFPVLRSATDIVVVVDDGVSIVVLIVNFPSLVLVFVDDETPELTSPNASEYKGTKVPAVISTMKEITQTTFGDACIFKLKRIPKTLLDY